MPALLADFDFLRWHVSLDLDDMAAILTAVAALLTAVLWRRQYNKTRALSETVDAPVLKEFLALTEKVTEVRTQLAEARSEIKALREEVREANQQEAYLQGVIHEKNKEIEEMRVALRKNKDRIQHLEDVCRKAGLNGI